MRIAIPDDVYRDAVLQGAGRGARKLAILREYLADKLPNGHELDDWEREGTKVYALTVAAVVRRERAEARIRHNIREALLARERSGRQ
jgi:hypothetical protein